MGGQQSTRKITISNQDPKNVIQVSESVIERLKGAREASTSSLNSTPAAAAAPLLVQPPPPIISPGSPSIYTYDPAPTSLQLRQDKEAALKKNDAYWQERINKILETQTQINQTIDKEYKDAMSEVKDKEDISVVKRKTPCQEGKKAVLDCYKKYRTEPIRCAKEVQDFANCVDKQRIELISNRG